MHWHLPVTIRTMEGVVHVLFSSHDGFGLGHVRRNVRLAQAVLAERPDARVTVVTGLAHRMPWLDDARIRVVRVPPLLKQPDGSYCGMTGDFGDALRTRQNVFVDLIKVSRPDVVVVDRHPYGTAGELRRGIELARQQGSTVVLGLRDILDEPQVIRAELAGAGWRDVTELFDSIVVYGDRVLCDHQREYGLPMEPTYCGWVSDGSRANTADGRTIAAPSTRPQTKHLVVGAGGGGDGDETLRLGSALAETLDTWNVSLVAGPFARELDELACQRVAVLHNVDTTDLLRSADAVLQMAGYNSTVESLAAGLRPILMPRRSPRREQAIRAGRLAALGLAHMIDQATSAAEVAWILERDQRVTEDELRDGGLRLDGAQRTARLLLERRAVRS